MLRDPRTNEPIKPYIRGFLFGTVAPPVVPDTFHRVDPDLYLYADARATYGFHRRPPGLMRRAGGQRAPDFVFLTGNPVDPDHPADDINAIAARCFRAIRQERGGFQAILRRLVGRFAVVWSWRGAGPFAMTDVTGLRSLFRCGLGAGALISSHATLLNRQLGGAEKTPFPYKWGYPGGDTPFEGVFLHSPSTVLDVAALTAQRLFLTEPLPERSPEEAAGMIIDRARRALEAICRHHRPLVSLTAGADSRVTLAVSRPFWPRLRFFSYVDWNGTELDARLAAQIARELGLDHTVVRDTEEGRTPEDEAYFAENSYYAHMRPINRHYLSAFGIDQYLHVRSNIVELFRQTPVETLAKAANAYPETPQEAARLYLLDGQIERTPENTRLVTDAFERQFAFNDWPSALRHTDCLDLYYLEQAMGAWHSMVPLSSDYSFDTTVLFNSREIIETGLGVPKALRLQNRLFDEIYRQAAPEVLRWPINPATV